MDLSLWVQNQSGLNIEFQDSQGYMERPRLKQTKQNKQETTKKEQRKKYTNKYRI